MREFNEVELNTILAYIPNNSNLVLLANTFKCDYEDLKYVYERAYFHKQKYIDTYSDYDKLIVKVKEDLGIVNLG